MHQQIAETLAEIDALASPVARSCHVGNNGSNVWGWLALTPNTKLVQFDHTRYGLDENAVPWTVLGDCGRLVACFDHNGNEKAEWLGRHVSEHLLSIEYRYFGLLNYQIHADYQGRDLLQHHFATASHLSYQINGSRASCDCAELLSIEPLVREIIECFAERRCLHLAFDRWVRNDGIQGRRIISYPIRGIQYPMPGEVNIIDSNGRMVFFGSAERLWRHLMDGARRVVRRLSDGEPIGVVDYPWLTLELGYFIQSVKEFTIDRTQRQFWHAGGPSSQYYVNRPEFRCRARDVHNVLASAGLLPLNARLTIIPAFSCQLCATNGDGLAILEEIVQSWRDYLARSRDQLIRALLSLQRTVNPLEVARRAYERIDRKFLKSLDLTLSAFNSVDRNHLPVAHVAGLKHSHYNKFGAAQSAFMEVKPAFPHGFREMKWGEAELLIKIMAQMYADRSEMGPRP